MTCAGIRSAATNTTATAFAVELALSVISKHLVENANQPSGGQVVLHETASEVANAHLANRGRGHDVAGIDVRRAHHATQHDDLSIAVDLDLANTFEDQIAIGQHLSDAGRHY